MANNRRRAGGFGFSASLTGPGGIFTIAFIALAIGFAVLLTRGITPSSTLTEPENKDEFVEIIPEDQDPKQQGLQLKTLKFRQCGGKVAVGLLVDRSGSMEGSKMTSLKTALTTFTSTLSDESVVGMSSFSSSDAPAGVVREDVKISKFADVKSDFPDAIYQLRAYGGTNSRTAFQFMRDKLLSAKSEFPDQQFSLIFLSDGIPEADSEQYPLNCPSGRYTLSTYSTLNYRCFALSQDPTRSPNIAQEIKDAGIKIYTIALYDPLRSDDVYFLPDMRNMMQNISSTPTDKTYYEIPDPTKLQEIYKEIGQKICSDVK